MSIQPLVDEAEPVEPQTRAQWYPLGAPDALGPVPLRTLLLGRDIVCARDGDDIRVLDGNRVLPAVVRYGTLWTTLAEPGDPEMVLPEVPEADEADRRLVGCGAIAVASSGLRLVENFLDMAHFPFVHTGILGAEPHTEVARYEIELRETPGAAMSEVWATHCRFFQPQAALAASGGILTDYTYRVAAPFATLLYKTSPGQDSRQDVIALFIQPMTPTTARAHPVMFLLDDTSTTEALVEFQQTIFLQDRIILENQRPALLPLDASTEIPTLADRASVAYRRWLKANGVRYGALN